VELATGRTAKRFKGKDGVHAVSFNADGRLALSGEHAGTIRLWDVASAQELASIKAHELQVFDVACSPDGRYAVSCSWEATVPLWDLRTKRQLLQFIG